MRGGAGVGMIDEKGFLCLALSWQHRWEEKTSACAMFGR